MNPLLSHEQSLVKTSQSHMNNPLEYYRQHIRNSISNANQEISKLSPAVLALPGMSQRKNRHLLNNLASLPDLTYLEVGLYKGSTFISALYGNHPEEATGIDNWSEFTDIGHVLDGNTDPNLSIKDQFARAFDAHVGINKRVQWHDIDSWSFDVNRIKKPVNLFLYDGHHGFESQRRAYHHFNPVLAKVFMTVIDDWECSSGGPRGGTLQAFLDLGYKIHEMIELPSGIPDGYHGGVAVALVEKA